MSSRILSLTGQINDSRHSDISDPWQGSDDDQELLVIKQSYRPGSRETCVHEHLSPTLKFLAEKELRYVDENHSCFKLSRLLAFREKYKINDNPWNHFIHLLCGCADLPVIILQNPSNKHSDEYNEAAPCFSLGWILETLKSPEIGLDLKDVIILDICSLLSDNDLNRMGRKHATTWDAVEESYAITEEILKELRPTVALCCQCVTSNGRSYPEKTKFWMPAKISLAKELCSSPEQARLGSTKTLIIETSGKPHTILMVCGVHPMLTVHEPRMEPVLKGVFEDVYGPCRKYYNAHREQVVKPTAMRRRVRHAGESSQQSVENDMMEDIINEVLALEI